MFRHLAILKFKPEASEAARKRFLDNFPNMAKSIPQIKAWSIGRDAGLGGLGGHLADVLGQVLKGKLALGNRGKSNVRDLPRVFRGEPIGI